MKKHRLSIRYQLLLLYMLVVVAVCLVYLPLSRSVRAQLLEHYQTQSRQLFERSLETFDHSVQLLYDVPDVMIGHTYYRECIVSREDVKTLLPKLYMTAPLLTGYLASIPLVDKAFLLFLNSGAIIDDHQIYITQADFSQFGLPTQSAQEILTLLSSEASFHQLSGVRLNRSAGQSALLLFMDRIRTKVRVGAVYDEDTLRALFNLYGYPAGTSLRMTDAQGAVFYRQGAADEDCVAFSGTISLPYMNVTLSIPVAYFNTLLSGYDSMFQSTLAAALGVGVTLSIALTVINYRPLKRLLRRVDDQFLCQQKNEYDQINAYMQHRENQITTLGVKLDGLRENLRSSMFARLLTSSLPTVAETELGLSLLPELNENNHLAVVRIHAADTQAPMVFAPFAFLGEMADAGYFQQTAYDQAVLLFRTGDDHLARLHALLEKQQGLLNEYGMTVTAGVSEMFRGIENMHVAYRHAELALTGCALMRCFTASTPFSAPQPMDFRELQRLYEMLLAAEDDAVEEMLRATEARLNERQAEHSQYQQLAVLAEFVFETVIEDLRLADVSCTKAADMQHMSGGQIINQLCSDAQVIVGRIHSLRERFASESRTSVMTYIEENFASAACCAETIAQAVQMSTNSVYQIVREQTGHSLGELIESLRAEKACTLLKTTNLSVVDIAGQCGYPVPATFYRAFKRSRGVTPSQYRAKLRGPGERT